MTKQLSLFPDSPVHISAGVPDEKMADLENILNPVDEVFAGSPRYRDSRNLRELLHFIARFPTYSPFNGWLLYIQNSSATYVATARSWLQKFRRTPKFDARPIIILAPMAPILFVFDIQDTEGPPVPDTLLRTGAKQNQLPGKFFSNTCHNCSIHGIAVHEPSRDEKAVDTANRLVPALRKQYQHLALPKDTSYLIPINPRQSLEDKYASLAHELGHIFCGHLGIDRHAWWPEREDLSIKGDEIEADAVAYLVCERLGLQTSSTKFLSNHIVKHNELPVFSLNAVLQAVSYIEEMGKSRWSEPKKRGRG